MSQITPQQALSNVAEVCTTARLTMQENEILRQSLSVLNNIINPPPALPKEDSAPKEETNNT